MPIEDALDRFILQLRADGRSDHTVRQYRRHVRALKKWLVDEDRHDDTAAISHEAIAAFLVSPAAGHRPDGSPKKATSTNALRSSIRNFFGYLHRAGDIDADPSRLVRRARCEPPPPRALSEDERARLLAALDECTSPEDVRDRALFRLMLATGIRIGAAVTLALFIALGVAGMQAAYRAPDRFGMLLAVGITTWVIVQALLNLGAVLAVLPITGVTLPFLSLGGSSVVVTLTSMGILMNVARQGR